MEWIPGWELAFTPQQDQDQQSSTSSASPSSPMPPLFWAQARESGTGYLRHGLAVFEHRTNPVGPWGCTSWGLAVSAVEHALTLVQC
jgi:hypothetical protein